ncbi:MAG: hypothetical protein QOJ29_3784 [Thermoleophilaceae bacterium]|nr:hypothetical protein [Thermoleophilaceae bacterium]
MRLLIPAAAAALLLLLAEGGAASSTALLKVSPKHGHRYSTYVVSFKAEYASSKASKTQYVLGAVNSNKCTSGVNSFGKIQTGPYRVGETVRFRISYPKQGLCVGVFHGVGHFERKVGDRWTDRRVGRFAFRVLRS